MSKITTAVEGYVDAFTGLTPNNMENLLAKVDNNIYFSDPFNSTYGKAAFTAIFDHMFQTCIAPGFDVTDIAYSSKKGDATAYLRWRMSGKINGWPHTDLDFEGMTEVHVGKTGLITAHIDHWDSASQLFARLPVIGGILRPIMKRFVVKTPPA